ncbi:hypothetical protein SAMN05444004_103287 [Jannaschia faecimaris]|uniref:Uncharacterized protein n=1 Tax=Jannaschia faecimaris TaxID=1244108 RepID=A0A1H3N6I9_9RHOB|nr:hypothetical protein [Jannaschia faecimaris]SDY84438.1 hypothetical protein SAMN05444004_103287 [Jannaschia faecimaris]
MKFHVSIGILAGNFAAQQLAFAHLLDVAPEADFDQVEVIRRNFEARLAHFFAAGEGPETISEDTLVLILPGAKVPLVRTDHLRVVGRFPGKITRALIPEED